MGVNTDANAAVQRWIAGMGAATTKYTEGVQRVQTAPGVSAARQQNAYVSGVTASAPIWAKKVAAVSLSDWQTAAAQKGAPRLATGAQAAQGKMQNFLQSFLPALASAVASLPPRGPYEQNKARSAALMDALHAKRGSFGG